MYKPIDEAVALAVLSSACNGVDSLSAYLAKHYRGGNSIALIQRLQEMSISYSTGFTLPDYSDLLQCLAQEPHTSDLAPQLRQRLLSWLHALAPYARMSLSSLANAMTCNYKYWIIDASSPYWPRQLNHISTRTDSEAPLCLWGLGSIDALCSCDAPISIVGSRSVDAYGRYVAFHAGKYAAMHGHMVVSGGALGADAAAHWGALAASDILDEPGRTVAIMAGGLHHMGPTRNTTLFERILQSEGAIISELAPDVVPEPYRFLERNRLIAALGSTLIVAQAQHRSGALNTATWAATMNRDVLAAPGNIHEPYNSGCNRLIANHKASVLVSATDMSDVCHPAHDPYKTSSHTTDTSLSPP